MSLEDGGGAVGSRSSLAQAVHRAAGVRGWARAVGGVGGRGVRMSLRTSVYAGPVLPVMCRSTGVCATH